MKFSRNLSPHEVYKILSEASMWILLSPFLYVGKDKKGHQGSLSNQWGQTSRTKELMQRKRDGFKQEMLVAMATLGYVQQIIFMKIIYSISERRGWFSSAKMIIIFIN